jgi:hypothetical protein
MNNKEWIKTVMARCKHKRENTDSSAYCVYCRKYGGSCTFKNCKIKTK